MALDKDDFMKALTTYFRMAGWDENGVPTEAKLAELDLVGVGMEDA